MPVTFKVKESDDNFHDAEMDLTDTMMNLKQLIIKNMKLDVNYIDLNFLIDKPIRGFGKMNLDKGIIPRTMDNLIDIIQKVKKFFVNLFLFKIILQILKVKVIIQKEFIQHRV